MKPEEQAIIDAARELLKKALGEVDGCVSEDGASDLYWTVIEKLHPLFSTLEPNQWKN